MDAILDRLATYKEKILALKSKIKSALMYPISVIVVAFLVLTPDGQFVPRWSLFLAVIASKLHEFGESQRRLALAKRFQEESAYWTKRFTVLGMSAIADRLQAANTLTVPLAA